MDIFAVESLGVVYDTAFSLRSQLQSRRTRKYSSRVRNEMAGFGARWRQGHGAVELANEARYPPYLFWRFLAETLLGCSKAKVGRAPFSHRTIAIAIKTCSLCVFTKYTPQAGIRVSEAAEPDPR